MLREHAILRICIPESPDFFFARRVDHRPNRRNGYAASEGGLAHRIWLQHSAQKMRDVLALIELSEPARRRKF